MTAPTRCRFSRNKSGASAVEFALIAAPLVLMVLGSIEFARARWTQQAVNETAINSARCMGIRQTECTLNATYNSAKTTGYVQTLGSGWGLSIPASGITLDSNATCNGVSGFSRVTVTYVFQSAVPAALIALFQNVTMIGDACFPNQPTS